MARELPIPSRNSQTHTPKASAQRNDDTPAATLGDRRCILTILSRHSAVQEFAEPVAVSSTDSADIRLPPSALEVGFDLLPLRARRTVESTQRRRTRQECEPTKIVQRADKCSPHCPHSMNRSVESSEPGLERARPAVERDDREDDRRRHEPVDDEHGVRVAAHVVEQDPDCCERRHGRRQHADDERAGRAGG